jgi:hypothetical protein
MRPSTPLIVIDLLSKVAAHGNFYQEVTLCSCILKNNSTLDRVTITSTLYSIEMQFSKARFSTTGVRLCICVSKLYVIKFSTSVYLCFQLPCIPVFNFCVFSFLTSIAFSRSVYLRFQPQCICFFKFCVIALSTSL